VALESPDVRERTVTQVVPVQVQRILYQLTRRRCPECRRVFSAKVPGVLPKFKQDNSVLAHVAIEHYLHQITLGHLAVRLGINESRFIEAMHHLTQLFKEVPKKLIAKPRSSTPMKPRGAATAATVMPGFFVRRRGHPRALDDHAAHPEKTQNR
jgi:hypothetical protein